jgi:hypothetical protein
MAWIVYDSESGSPTEISHSPFIIGRSSDCDLLLKSATVSRHHLQLVLAKKNLEINSVSPESVFLMRGTSQTHFVIEPKYVGIIEIGSVKLIFAPKHVNVETIIKKHFVSDTKYCFSTDGVVDGPYTEGKLLEQVNAGNLRPDSLIWEFGQENEKVLASEVEGLEFPNFAPAHNVNSSRVTTFSIDDGEGFMCPFCRHTTSLDNVLAVAIDPNSVGDPVLGESEQQRFLPTRFTPNGQAIDAGGFVCPDIACPKCHMTLPSAVLNNPLRIMSIVGAPGSGKSYFLASSAWNMRHVLPSRFGLGFMDVDPMINRWLNAYEEKLFFQEDSAEIQNIVKTDLQSTMVYRQILMDGHPMFLPLPSLFSISTANPEEQHILALYDNAGEHFQVGADSRSMPGTLHMLHAESILFLFDPSGDPRFRDILAKGTGTASNKAQRQDVLLTEMATRMRRHLGNQSTAKLEKPIIFGVSKADLLLHLLPGDISPYHTNESGQQCLDLTAISNMSAVLRKVIKKLAPELVHTVESIGHHVVYMPISALGHNPMKEGVRPCDIHAFWVEMPLVYTLGSMGIIPTVGSLKP